MNKAKLLILPLISWIFSAQAVNFPDKDTNPLKKFDEKERQELLQQSTDLAKKGLEKVNEVGKKTYNTAKDLYIAYANYQNKKNENLPAPTQPANSTINETPSLIENQTPSIETKESKIPVEPNEKPALPLEPTENKNASSQDEVITLPLDENPTFIKNHFNNTLIQRLSICLFVDKLVRSTMPKASPLKKGLASFLAQASTGLFIFDREVLNASYGLKESREIQKALALYGLKVGLTYIATHKLNDLLTIAHKKITDFQARRATQQ